MRDDIIERIDTYLASQEGQLSMMQHRAGALLLDECRRTIIEMLGTIENLHYECNVLFESLEET